MVEAVGGNTRAKGPGFPSQGQRPGSKPVPQRRAESERSAFPQKNVVIRDRLRWQPNEPEGVEVDEGMLADNYRGASGRVITWQAKRGA